MRERTQGAGGEADHAASFPIVAIGASAGGLEALRQLFSRLPDDTGMAFVVIQHLDPEHPSMLASVLATEVGMQVAEVTGATRAEPNRVYVIPPDADLAIHRGILELVPRQQTRKLHLPIDAFFRSLAEDLSSRAIGVVLSGAGSDGTDGLHAIKAAGGITVAQDPSSAQFRSMPESAIAAGVVDYRLPPRELADELVRLSRHPYLAPAEATVTSPEELRPDDEDALARVLAAVHQHAQLDFRGYKRPTLLRRIDRRMALRRVHSMDAYAESLRNAPGEARALAEDILIHVTSFFRDPGAFEALQHHVLPELLAHKDDDSTLRVWVPGCSTGEEAYSIAICLLEVLADQQRRPTIKIFGSDLSGRAIETARAALYSESEIEGVSPERIARFFERVEGRYRIGKQVRDLCVFVRHDLTRDPPFARLDLISCRNVLIYFDNELQNRVVPLLHHCLNTPGYLLLGSSEGLRESEDLFVPIDKKHRIFLKKGESPRIHYPLALGRDAESRIPVFHPVQRTQPARDAQRQADHILLARYAPPGVVVNARLEVVQFRGRTGEFLEPPSGQPQTNILKLAREGLVGPLRDALEEAKTRSVAVRRERVRLTGDAPGRAVNLEVIPLAGFATSDDGYFLILFEEVRPNGRGGAAAAARPPAYAARRPADDEVARLRSELAAARDYVQAITDEHKDTTEELGAANEELIAANEELQSTNEELQSAKEELQSTNEELITLNDELHNRNQQLDVVANDLVNVLESVQIPVIMVDQSLRIRRFTPIAREISSLLPGDVGRSIDDVKLKVRVDDLPEKIRDTISSVSPKEYEVQAVDGRWFRLHIRPYRTADNRLDGAVLSFLDVDVLKRAVQEAESARDYARSIVETVPIALAVLGADLRIVSANSNFYRAFTARSDLPVNAGFFELAVGALDVTALREAMSRCLADDVSFHELELQGSVPGRGKMSLVTSGCPIRGSHGEPLLLLAIEDITERRLLEASELQSRLEAERANRAKDLFLATLSHELRTPLSTILMSAQLLQMVDSDDPRVRRASSAIERAVGTQSRLINDLLDISRIVSGKLMLDLQAVDFAAVVQNAVEVTQGVAEAKGLALELDLRGPLGPIHGDPTRLHQVVTNLLTNAIKFTPRGGKVSVTLEAVDGTARLRVSDTGLGVRPELLPHLFNRFVQAESSMTRAHGGLGLGLAIVRHIVEVHGGEVHVESPGEGMGSTFTVTLPMTVEEAEASTPRMTMTRSISGVRVLLVEDDDDTRQTCTAMLELQGAEVRAARSTEEGLSALETFSPQVILCDIAMPGEDGYAFIRRVRSGDRSRDVPAAALTALAGEDDRRRALEAGFQLHLAKPIDANRLATAVANLAEWSRPGGPAAHHLKPG